MGFRALRGTGFQGWGGGREIAAALFLSQSPSHAPDNKPTTCLASKPNSTHRLPRRVQRIG